MALQGSDLFVISRSGTHYKLLASDILAYIQDNMGSTDYQAANIAARNGLGNLSAGDTVLVDDATADASVDSGWAIYRYVSPGTFQKIAEEESMDVVVSGGGDTDLSYTPSPSAGVVVSSTGDNATLPAANDTNAGLMLPGQFDKLAHLTVTAATDLDAIRSNSHAPVSTAGSATTNPIVVTGQNIDFSISNLTTAP